MGLGQTLLTVMALMLMGRLILSINSVTLDTTSNVDIAGARISATSLGTSILEKASGLNFDNASASQEIYPSLATALLTKGGDFFGTEGAGERVNLRGQPSDSLFDDFDDYHKWVHIDSIDNGVYKESVYVEYVKIVGTSPNQTIQTSATQTFNKRMSVFVTSPTMVNYGQLDYTKTPPEPKPDTLKFQTIFTYWWFR